MFQQTQNFSLPPMNSPKNKYEKTNSFEPKLETRMWPNRRVSMAPAWCSVDLRDGNQALKNPMTLEEKLKFWNMLINVGFKEIEIGFPSASKVENEFTRTLIENNLIPDNVVVQVLSQSRKEQIEKTIEALEGTKQAIVHLYNSTSELQRRVVFRKDENQIIDIILNGVNELSNLKEKTDTKIMLEYSPESFTGTEPDFALKICNAVVAMWQPTPDDKMIINLPATVEMTAPNIFADQIEYFSRNIRRRDSIILSVHPHNDMGMALGAAELALLAGADRVEGTLFGNGERTGNLDLLVMGLNLYSRGIDPKLNFSNVDEIRKVYEECTHMKIHSRHPYAGKAVFTAYSGSHQDAINKGVNAMRENDTDKWEVPYLPIDPSDIGRKYEAVVINSQSGKGGTAFILREKYQIDMPKEMHAEFGKIVQKYCDEKKVAISPHEIKELFAKTYLNKDAKYKVLGMAVRDNGAKVKIEAKILNNGKIMALEGQGNDVLEAFNQGIFLSSNVSCKANIIGGHEIVRKDGKKLFVSYIKLIDKNTGLETYGVGIGKNNKIASIKAYVSALNNKR